MNTKELKSLANIGQSSMKAGDIATSLLVIRHLFEFHSEVAKMAMDLLEMPEGTKDAGFWIREGETECRGDGEPSGTKS